MTSYHKNLPAVEIHKPFAFEFVNQTVREEMTGLIESDINKIAIQLDDGSAWILTSISPIIWKPLGAETIFGTTSGTACEGNDYRLSDSRTPLSHSHNAADLNTGTIDIARLPHGALERLVTVADEAARFALTTATIQTGDTVKQISPNGDMYFVIDDTKLNSADGYTIYTAGTAASVPWSGVTDKPSTFAPASHDRNSHSDINQELLTTSSPSFAGLNITGSVYTNSVRTSVISSLAPSGGKNGDVWYQF